MFQIDELVDIVEKNISTIGLNSEPKNIYEPIRYILANGGKRIRPVLTLTACNLFSDSIEKAINPAVAIEVFHNFTLVHDDIMDKADMRRGKATIHKKWNENIGILSGDAMSIIAYQLLIKTDTQYIHRILPVFNSVALAICEGQQYDMDFETRSRVTEDEYLGMIELKTSVLLGGALKIGAIIGGASDFDTDLLGEFGRNLGVAFQLQDDLLDVYGDPSVFGKKLGGDIRANKKTILTIKAYKLASDQQIVELDKCFFSNKYNDLIKVQKVVEIYNELDIKLIVEGMISKYFQRALDLLHSVDVRCERKEVLLDLSNRVMMRVK